ncbi:dienelactone hydrolase family protein [Sphingomonas sp.]|uniref:dienelactone hydrolase family protein n=1 Tax=Sphingomonas sp. TaxID=28214 RepID=UPI0017E3C216|nr:dienelactone hydrolase family protein [Sphingomonas sp.]MBA3511280.1 dienelactone hydrolase family protein [Sphingomonas sp.]
MLDDDIRSQAIALYDRFTHEGMDRRLFMRRMVALAGSVAAAEALIGAISASPAAAAIIPENDRRIRTSTGSLLGTGKFPRHSVYIAEQAKAPPRRPTVMVIHENRGLNAHIKDVTRRLAVAGFYAVAPDFLSPSGGTPADEDSAREAIGKLDLAASTAAAVEMIGELKARVDGGPQVGAVGFCWGGGFVNRLAVAAGDRLDAGVVYYGPAPDRSEASKVQAPLMIHHAGLDARIAQTLWPWITALRAAGKPVTYFNYQGANHAFNNDTSAERYDKAAAGLAWKRTLRFFRKHLSA